jgi:hypothetical protein
LGVRSTFKRMSNILLSLNTDLNLKCIVLPDIYNTLLESDGIQNVCVSFNDRGCLVGNCECYGTVFSETLD